MQSEQHHQQQQQQQQTSTQGGNAHLDDTTILEYDVTDEDDGGEVHPQLLEHAQIPLVHMAEDTYIQTHLSASDHVSMNGIGTERPGSGGDEEVHTPLNSEHLS